MAVRIRLKLLGRKHRPFFRICAMDSRAPRDGKVLEELGHYDPMVRETDARAVLNGERISYWLGVGALPTDKVKVLIKKYGQQGTHLQQQQEALARLRTTKPMAPPPRPVPLRSAQAESQAQAAQTQAGEPAADEQTAGDAGPATENLEAATEESGS